MRPFSLLRFAVIVVSLGAIPLSAYPEPRAYESAYLDLIFGHCFEAVTGKAISDSVPDVSEWSDVVNWNGSEASMNTDRSKVDLRIKMFESEEVGITVDLKNKEICWTQIDGVDAATIAARVRLMILDSQYEGIIFDQVFDRTPSGDISRMTTFGLAGWRDDVNIPVILMREPIHPMYEAITVQVLLGQKGPDREQ